MKIIVLCAQFFPLNVAGAYRPSKFVKYLKGLGVEPVVVTIPPHQASEFFGSSLDSNLMEDLGDDFVFYQVPLENGKKFSTGLRGYFDIVDNTAKLWKDNLLRELPKIIDKEKPTWIYTSLPPFSLGRLSVDIARDYGLKLVLDLRDAWSQWCIVPYKTYWHYKRTLKEEGYCLHHADVVLTTSKQTLEEMRRLHPLVLDEKFHVLPNGYDANIDWTLPACSKSKKHFTIGYVGSFYYSPEMRNNIYRKWWEKSPHKWFQYIPVKEDWLYRSPYFFFKTLHACFKYNPSLKEIVRLDFVGKEPEWLLDMLEEFNLKSIYRSHGFVSNGQALKIQEDFDAFLATSAKIDGKEDYSFGSKNFEYIQFKKPIIGFTPIGVLREFLQKSGLGIIFDPDDIQSSVKKLEELINDKIFVEPNHQFLMKFHRKSLAEKLLSILKENESK